MTEAPRLNNPIHCLIVFFVIAVVIPLFSLSCNRDNGKVASKVNMDTFTALIIEKERKREEERKHLEEEARIQQEEQAAARELEARKAAQEAEQEYNELEQAGMRMEMSQGIIQSARNYYQHEDDMFGDVPLPKRPGREAGVFGAFMQGITFDRADLFGTYGEGEPYGIVQKGSKLFGKLCSILLPLVLIWYFVKIASKPS